MDDYIELMDKAKTKEVSRKKYFNERETIDDLRTLIQILEGFIDYSKFSIDGEIISRCAADSDLMKEIQRKLFPTLNCSGKGSGNGCRNKEFISVNRCGHSYCIQCIAKNIVEEKNCEICKAEFSEELIHKIPQNSKESPATKIKIVCKSCRINTLNMNVEGSCNHICIHCIKKQADLFINECPICFRELFTDDNFSPFSKLTANCDGCNTEKSFLQEDFHKFKCNHILCGECIFISIQKNTCIICEKRLSQLELLEFIRAGSQQCIDCKKIVSIKSILRDPNRKGFICKKCHMIARKKK